jgi:hypothetical protein
MTQPLFVRVLQYVTLLDIMYLQDVYWELEVYCTVNQRAERAFFHKTRKSCETICLNEREINIEIHR